MPGRPRRYNYRLNEILTLRNTLTTAVFTEFRNETLTSEKFAALVDLLIIALPGRHYRPTIEESIRYLCGVQLTDEMVRDMCWRLAGNVKRLEERWTVTPWSTQRINEWVPLSIIGCTRYRQYDRPGAMFYFRIVAGTSCPLTTHRWWSLPQCKYFAPLIGFDKPRRHSDQQPDHVMTAPEQFVGLRLYGLIEPRFSEHGPRFETVVFPSAIREWNRTLLRRRLRLTENYVCPKGHPASFVCHRCPVGYLQCPMATHRENWKRDLCEKCQEENWFDPGQNQRFCVDCVVSESFKRTKLDL